MDMAGRAGERIFDMREGVGGQSPKPGDPAWRCPPLKDAHLWAAEREQRGRPWWGVRGPASGAGSAGKRPARLGCASPRPAAPGTLPEPACRDLLSGTPGAVCWLPREEIKLLLKTGKPSKGLRS